ALRINHRNGLLLSCVVNAAGILGVCRDVAGLASRLTVVVDVLYAITFDAVLGFGVTRDDEHRPINPRFFSIPLLAGLFGKGGVLVETDLLGGVDDGTLGGNGIGRPTRGHDG